MRSLAASVITTTLHHLHAGIAISLEWISLDWIALESLALRIIVNQLLTLNKIKTENDE